MTVGGGGGPLRSPPVLHGAVHSVVLIELLLLLLLVVGQRSGRPGTLLLDVVRLLRCAPVQTVVAGHLDAACRKTVEVVGRHRNGRGRCRDKALVRERLTGDLLGRRVQFRVLMEKKKTLNFYKYCR